MHYVSVVLINALELANIYAMRYIIPKNKFKPDRDQGKCFILKYAM